MGEGGQTRRRWTDDETILRALQVISLAWLLVLGSPLQSLLAAPLTLAVRALVLTGVALAVGFYAWAVGGSSPYPPGRGTSPGALARGPARGRADRLRRWLPLGLLAALGVVYTVAFGDGWLDLLVFTGVAVAYRLPIRQASVSLPVVALLAAALAIGVHHAPGDAGPAFLLILSIGIGVSGGLYTRAMVRELRAARSELARLAVAEERLRFARDLHDLLGHSLSLIALKSELAHQLVAPAPERAAAEMRDVESVARTALREVREAVAGYRQPTLAGELAGAAELLAAAGVACQREGDLEPLPPGVEGVLAWTVREGVTNVIRHSRARRCTIRQAREADRVTVEVIDDGTGGPPADRSGGRHGLAGLAERVAAVGGEVAAGPRPGGGFGLRVCVPLPASQRSAAPAVRPGALAPGSPPAVAREEAIQR